MRMQIEGEVLEDLCEAIKSTGHNEGLMDLKDDRWMITSEGPASVILSAVLVPEPSMEVYDRNGYEKVGVRLDKIIEFVKRTDSELVNMWIDKRTLNIEENDGNTHAELATIDIDSVAGKTDKGLNIEHEVKFESEFDFIRDFISIIEEITNTDHYFIGCRENGLYLYGEHDNGKMDTFNSWDEFDNVEINWDVNNSDVGHTPSEDKAIDVIFGCGFSKEIHHPTDKAHISIGNHFPMRILYELDNGAKVSYFQTPRIPDSSSSRDVLPENVIEKHR